MTHSELLAAIQLAYSRGSWLGLENRLLAALAAVCAYVMRRLGALCLWLQRASKRPRPDGLQFISLLLSFPCFEVSHLFFQLTYLLNQRRALLINRKNLALGIDQLPIEFDDLRLKGLSIVQTHDRLRDVLQRIERTEGRGDHEHAVL